jgi:hypothetical protein
MFLELPIRIIAGKKIKIFLKISKEINLVKFFFHAPRTTADGYEQIRTDLKSSFHHQKAKSKTHVKILSA